MNRVHNKATIISMAVLAYGAAVLLHEGIGHGLTAWLRGDVPTELTSNHLSSIHPDRWVEAGGTLVNLIAGALAVVRSRDLWLSANQRYFFWLFAAFNLLAGSGYFLFSGILGLGDWQAVINGLPYQSALRVIMAIAGAILYVAFVRLLAIAVRPFCPDRGTYNIVGRLPYVAGCLFSCAAGALDPLGWKLFFLSTVPAAFGGSSGLLWADSLMPRSSEEAPLFVSRARGWWIAAVVLGLAYIVIIGRGIRFLH